MKNIFERGLFLDEATHTYTLADKPDAAFLSATTFVNGYFAPFDELRIATDLCTNNSRYADKTVQDLLNQWKNETQAGTDAHKELDNYFINGSIPAMPKAKHGMEWMKRQNWDGMELCSEVGIFSESLGIAGTVDLIVRDTATNIFSLYDWKTNKKLDYSGYGRKGIQPPTAHMEDCKFIKYSLQLSLYRYILELEYDIKVAGHTILHLQNEGCREYPVNYLKPDLLEMIAHWKNKK